MPNSTNSLTFAMRDNKLCVYWGGEFSHSIRLWPRPYAEELSERTNRWERFFPEFRVVSYPLPKPKVKNRNQLELALDISESYRPDKLSKRRAYDLLRQTLPPSYAFAVAPFKCHQWSIMVYLWKNRRFYELLKSNPVLTFSLANDREVNWGVYMKELSLEKITGMKQTALLKLLDLPDTKSMVQLFRKVHPASASPHLRRQIKYCLRDDSSLKKLTHLKKINAGVLHLLTSVETVRSTLTPQLLEEVSLNPGNNHYPFAAHRLGECVRWHNQMYQNRSFPRVRSLENLNTYHEKLAAEVDRLLEMQQREERQQRAQAQADRDRELERALKTPFPKPPLAGTDAIVPLRTARDLIMEGQVQQNCVGHYAHSVRSGGNYIYKVLKPERATLSIVRSAGNQWSVGELKTKCNAPAQSATRKKVEQWLCSHQLGV